MHDPVTSFVVALFAQPGVALWMAGALLLFGIGIVVYTSYRDYAPLMRALNSRWNAMSSWRGNTAASIEELNRAFTESTDAPPVLLAGWLRYRGLLVEDQDGRLATPVRAADVFEALDEPARSLDWWSNIVVAIGLVVTFLGIVAALTEATSTIGTTGGGNMEAALMGLLAIAATKFWTSIAGVSASIILRVAARLRRQRIDSLSTSILAHLDSTVLFMPPEKALLQQGQTLRRIEALLAAKAEA